MGRLSREYLESSRLELEGCLVPPYALYGHGERMAGYLADVARINESLYKSNRIPFHT